jgi:hypothetical protein
LKKLVAFSVLSIPILIFINYLTTIIGIQYSFFSRALSLGNTQSDLSNIERYGIFVSFLNMLQDPKALFGFGFFNYMYYIHDYLPDFLSKVITYEAVIDIPTFNFLVQLIVENGIILSMIFTLVFLFYKKKVVFDNTLSKIEVKQRLIFHQTILLIIVVFSFSFSILTFSMTFIPILYSLLLNKADKKVVTNG